MPQPPITSNDEIPSASAKKLREQLAWELSRAKERRGCTNEQLARDLGYAGGGSISQWTRNHAPMPSSVANGLARLKLKPTVGGTFPDLHAAYVRAKKNPHKSARIPKQVFDVFLASPMASAAGSDEYKQERKVAIDIKNSLETYLDFSVYYAGGDLETDEDFETPEIAAEKNFEALQGAKFFVMVIQTEVGRPSSVHVEAGYALALGIPSVYYALNPQALPYVLRSIAGSRDENIPPVSIEYLSGATLIAAQIRKHGAEIFDRLDGLSRKSRSS